MRSDLTELVGRFAGKRIAVVGDVCLDEYLVGRAARLSREAPVPVLEFERRLVVPGAAANPARNVQALAGQASILSVVGDDESAATLREELAGIGITTELLVTDPDRQTTLKTRIVADVQLRFPQQVARIDRASRDPINPASRARLITGLEIAAREADAILLSGDRGGVIDEAVIAEARLAAERFGRPIAVDSQGDLRRFSGYDLVRSNRAEAEVTLGRDLDSEESIRSGTVELRDRLGAQAVVITLGPDGVAVQTDSAFRIIPAVNRSEVYDTVGAGDTVIAVLALGLAAGIDLFAAAEIANVAAGIVVRRFGNAVTTPDELREALERPE